MTDYPGSGYPQSPNPGEQPPPGGYGQPSRPEYGPPQQYGQPNRPEYGPPQQYGQPSQPPYGPPPGQPSYGPPPGQPPYGPGGFGPYGPPPDARSKMPWILGGIGVVVAAAVAVILVLTLGGGGSKSGPAAAVGKLFKADLDNDVAAQKALVCDPTSVSDGSDGLKSYKVGKSSEKGDSATVAVTATFDGSAGENGPSAGTFNLLVVTEKREGAWKVCDLKQANPSSGGNAPSGSATLPSGLPTDLPTDLPSGLPTGEPTGSVCITPPTSLPDATPICIPN